MTLRMKIVVLDKMSWMVIISLMKNYVPINHNIIIYSRYVYPEKYGVDFLKFKPLQKTKRFNCL